MKKNYYFTLIFVYFLVSSCAGGWSDATLTNEGQVIETEGYKITVPKGNGWTVRVNYSQGFVVLQKANPQGNTTSISVLTGRVKQALTESPGSLVSSVILNSELQSLKTRGKYRYDVNVKLKDFFTVGNKRLHVMSYEIIDYSKNVKKYIDYKMFIYLPPDFKSRKIFYTFLIGEPYRIGDYGVSEYETNLTIIDSVIKTFKEKDI